MENNNLNTVTPNIPRGHRIHNRIKSSLLTKKRTSFLFYHINYKHTTRHFLHLDPTPLDLPFFLCVKMAKFVFILLAFSFTYTSVLLAAHPPTPVEGT